MSHGLPVEEPRERLHRTPPRDPSRSPTRPYSSPPPSPQPHIITIPSTRHTEYEPPITPYRRPTSPPGTISERDMEGPPTIIRVTGTGPSRVASPRPTSPRPTIIPVPPEHTRQPSIRRPEGYHIPQFAPTESEEGEFRAPRPPPSTIESQLRAARDGEPVIPIVPSDRPRSPIPEVHRFPDEGRPGDAVPILARPLSRGAPISPIPRGPPSGPGDLAMFDEINERLTRISEHERRLAEIAQLAEEREERRERQFQEHEDERDRLFQEHEDLRDAETREHREEVLRDIVEQAPHIAPPPMEEPPLPVPTPDERAAALPGEEVPSIEIEYEDVPAESESIRTIPIAEPVPPVIPHMPQLQEILDLLRIQQAEAADQRAAEAEENQRLREEAETDRQRAKEECDKRIADLEAELERVKGELERERGLREEEERLRMEAEQHAAERHEAVMAQLGDLTHLMNQQREDCVRKDQITEARYNDKLIRQGQKDEQLGQMYAMLESVLRDNATEREVRERERQEAAERPSKCTYRHTLSNI